ncbi:Adaptive-response sensory-kinase SasA [Terrisporobacter mayombei]|uniref:histidine kinase n=2 Tax=Terrisporobacter mayombei TaxID=1541 RepID=A0ABY9PYU2_9FIRM|nr:Adaptive-response sensory-kinase SasA [Terrisporobacter mayombei]
MSILTFLAIVSIIVIMMIAQLAVVRVWTVKYEKDDIEAKYKEISMLINTNSNISYDNLFDTMDLDVMIYNQNKEIIYNSMSEIPSDLEFDNPYRIKSKILLNFKYDNVILNAPVTINGVKNNIYIFNKTDVFKDYLEATLHIMIFVVLLVIIISILAGMYISKKFVNKLKKLRDTMEEIKEKGISNRVEIHDEKDDFDKVNIVFNSMMDELENSFNAQKQFVNDASHELRTPLTIINGHLKMLDRWGKNDKGTLDKSIKVSLNEVERLTKLVNDLLQLSKAENELVGNSNLEEVNIKNVVNEVIYDFEIINKDVKFTYDIEDNLKLYMMREHLKQLLIIFIDNAIKYCDKEEKKIHISIFNHNNNIKICIRDNGIGIPEEDIPKITDKFYRVDESRKYNNSFGIGLSIAAQIIKLYKGSLNIESKIDEGTNVIIAFK